MERAYADQYRDLYERHWWWRAREAFLLHEIRRIAPANGFGKILDVGCGDGLFFPALAEFGSPEGVEPDSGLITSRGRASGVIYEQPFDENFRSTERYGLILCLDVLEHLDDDAAALRKALSLLAPGGWLLATVPALNCLWTSHDEVNQHRRRYSRRDVKRLAEAADATLKDLRYFFHWTVPVKAAVAGIERVFGGRPKQTAVPGAWVNRAIIAYSRAEQAISRSLPVPLGTSLFFSVQALPGETRAV
ncbi:MAG TPA: class I SAM-dependent methyltransferase [Pirellulales bacterium]